MSDSFEQVKPLEESQDSTLRQVREVDPESGNYKKLLCDPLASLVSSVDDNPVNSNVAVLGYN
jgi:hypothetical protein